MRAKKSVRKGIAAAGQPPSRPGFAWQIGALPLLVILTYWNSLNSSFHLDDALIFDDQHITGLGFGWETLRLMQTRPLTYLSFHWNYLAGGHSPEGYHWVNILLHAANAVLILLIARRLLPPLAAFLASSLFALHPLQTEAVTYIYARATPLETLFALLTILFFLRDRYWWSVTAFALSLLSKEEAVALPVFLLLYDLVVRRQRPRLGYYAALFGLVALAAARLFYVVSRLPAPRLGFHVKGISMFSYALTQCRVVWSYLRLFVFPVGLNVDHDVAPSQGLLSPPTTLVAVLGLIVLLAMLAWLTWKGEQPAFWMLGFFLLLAPSSSLVVQADLMFEHRTYLPLICLVVATAWLLWTPLARLPRRAQFAAMAALLLALAGATVARNQVWKDEKSLWTDAVQKSPNKVRALATLGLASWTDDPTRGRQLLERALALDDKDPVVHINLGVMLIDQDPTGALQHFQRALALGPENVTLWNNIGAAYGRLGNDDLAIASYRRALAIDPCNFVARRTLVALLVMEGKKEEGFQTGRIPEDCHLSADQARELEAYRESAR